MGIRPLCDSAKEVIEAKGITPKTYPEIFNCVSRYATPSTCGEKVNWVIYRIWNAVKSLFGMSDWQVAKDQLGKLAIQLQTASVVKKLKNINQKIATSSTPELHIKRHKNEQELKLMELHYKSEAEFLLSHSLFIENLHRNAGVTFSKGSRAIESEESSQPESNYESKLSLDAEAKDAERKQKSRLIRGSLGKKNSA